jgi:molybdate/tungstate transport system permease protein
MTPPRVRTAPFWNGWRALGAAALLAALHVSLAFLPDAPFTPPMNLVLYFTNLYVLYCAAVVLPGRSATTLLMFLAGYCALFALVLLALGKKPLFILLIVAYSSLFGSPVLIGFFVLFVVCFILLQPYSFESFIPLALLYALLWSVRRRTSLFARLCLGGGLLALAVVLFPLIHLATRDSVQTLWHTLQREDVQGAIGESLFSSTSATVVVALFGIPLAYALARIDFAGKRWVESLVDVPILVPQSVAGVAFMVLLGPGSPLGQGLAPLGIRVSGTALGIVVAQVFVAFPFLVKTAMTAFEGIPMSLERASRSLGASPAVTFLRVALPLASRGILVGLTLAWARAISEFGCIVLFASSPVTAPVLVHTEFLRAGATESRPIATLLLVTCVWIFVMLQFGQTLLPFALRKTRRETGA